MIKASIIITTLNRPELVLKRSLLSAEQQSFNYLEYEIILVDDGSTKSYEKVCEYMKGSLVAFTYIKFIKNIGLSYARNTGIEKARGEFIVCLDDDNMLHPNFLKETVAKIGIHAAVSVGRTVKYTEKNFETYAKPYSIGQKFISIDWGWLLRKSIFEYIQYDVKMRANEDADFGLQFTSYDNPSMMPFSYTSIDKPLAIAFDQEGDPKQSMSYPSPRILEGIQYYLDKNLHKYKDYPDELRYIYRLAGRRFYLGGQKKKGLNYFWKSFKAKPGLETLAQLLFIHLGWKVYDTFMTFEEKLASKLK